MKMKSIIASSGLALVTLFACDAVIFPDNKSEDIIREAERTGKKLSCATAEPFTTTIFNYNGSGTGVAPIGNGKISFTYPGETSDETVIVMRTASTPEATEEETKFALSNGLQATIIRTEDGSCTADMFEADGPNAFLYKVTRWPGNSTSNLRQGCCVMQ